MDDRNHERRDSIPPPSSLPLGFEAEISAGEPCFYDVFIGPPSTERDTLPASPTARRRRLEIPERRGAER